VPDLPASPPILRVPDFRPPMFTAAHLDAWFNFAGPAENDIPAHEAIRDAENVAMRAIHIARRIRDDIPIETQTEHDGRAIAATFQAFATAINDYAPDSADKTAAMHCVRLAFQLAREGLVVRQRTARGLESLWMHLHGQAIDQLYAARMWACAAVDGR